VRGKPVIWYANREDARRTGKQVNGEARQGYTERGPKGERWFIFA
jgi:hypothetical protein